MKQDDSSTVKQPENGKRWQEQSMQEQRLSCYAHAAVADRIRDALCSKLPSTCNDRIKERCNDNTNKIY